MSGIITPTILAENAEQYKEQVERVSGFAERVHIDITDGEFAPTLTVSVPELWGQGILRKYICELSWRDCTPLSSMSMDESLL